MSAKAYRPALDPDALVKRDLPALWEPGAFLVLSMRFPLSRAEPPRFLQLLIDVRVGICARAGLDPTPLGREVGAWLDAGLPAATPVAGIYTDNPKTVDRQTLIAWAETRGARAYCHPGCTLPTSVKALFDSLMGHWANAPWASDGPCGLAARQADLAAWRTAFNATRLAMAPTADTASGATADGGGSPASLSSPFQPGVPHVPHTR